MNDITRYPLYWPNNVPRTTPQARSYPKFSLVSISAAANGVLMEINRLNHRSWDYSDETVIISTNQKVRQDGLPLGSRLQWDDLQRAYDQALASFHEQTF